MARNRALHQLRSWRRFSATFARLAAQRTEDHQPAAAFEAADLLAAHLNPEDRALVLLRYVHGFSSGELAALTGLTDQALRKRLSRAGRALAKALAPDTPAAYQMQVR